MFSKTSYKCYLQLIVMPRPAPRLASLTTKTPLLGIIDSIKTQTVSFNACNLSENGLQYNLRKTYNFKVPCLLLLSDASKVLNMALANKVFSFYTLVKLLLLLLLQNARQVFTTCRLFRYSSVISIILSICQ
jgi:hypothetical protein